MDTQRPLGKFDPRKAVGDRAVGNLKKSRVQHLIIVKMRSRQRDLRNSWELGIQFPWEKGQLKLGSRERKER